MDSDKFWRLTYAEFISKYNGHVKKSRRKINELLYLAWNTQNFHAMLLRDRKLPDLKSVLIDEDEKPKEHHVQTTDEIMEVCKMWTAALGGDFVEVE